MIDQHVRDAIAELELGFAAEWPDGQRPDDREHPGWIHFAAALDHLRDIERAAQ